ncbi:MAG: FAD-dependent oxidoreductase [bacterium]|nr:FAD-dependent oxidoreductase [bacterium]
MFNMKRKLITCGLIFTLAVGAVGCGQKTESNDQVQTPSLSFTAGEYSATGTGRNGDINVTVKFTENKIESVVVGEHTETAGIATPAIEQIPVAITEGQTLKVDAVTGATLTSNGILDAVADCVKQANGDVEALKSIEVSKEDTKKDAEVYDTDIVIVGGGAAGLTAAISASSNGSSVIVVEKGASLAVANGANAGGPIAVGTKVQKEEGEDLTIETLYNHMNDYANSTINSALLRNVLDKTGETMDLFQDLGLTLSLRQDAYGVGFRARLKIAEKGLDRTTPQEQLVLKNGGQFLYNTTGESIIMNENNEAVGIKAKKADGTEVTVNAKAVLISTGGYLGSQEVISEKFGDVTVNPLGNTLSTGDGIKMISEVGGVEDRNWGIVANEFSASNAKNGAWNSKTSNQNLRFGIYGGLLVNSEGNRFFNEQIMAEEPLAGAEATLRQGKYYVVMDEAYYNSVCEQGIFKTLGSPQSWIAGVNCLSDSAPEGAHIKVLTEAKAQLQEAIDQGWGFKANTIEEAAEHFGLENLVTTVAAYNEFAKNGKDTQFYKDATFLTSVSEGPIYVFEYEASAWCTIGGMKVDDSLRVVDKTNTAIKGLYAAGVDAGSMFTSPYYDNEGSALGLSFGSGTLVGLNMTEYVKSLSK